MNDWIRVRPPRMPWRRHRRLDRAERRTVRNLVVLIGEPVSFQERTRRRDRKRTHRVLSPT